MQSNVLYKKLGFSFGKSPDAVRTFHEARRGRLFPALEAEIGELDKVHRDFVAICAAVRGDFPAEWFAWCGNGKPPVSRWSYFKASPFHLAFGVLVVAAEQVPRLLE